MKRIFCEYQKSLLDSLMTHHSAEHNYVPWRNVSKVVVLNFNFGMQSFVHVDVDFKQTTKSVFMQAMGAK